jgi:hypothetical protein
MHLSPAEDHAIDEAARQFPEPGDPADWLRAGSPERQQEAAAREAYLNEPGDLYLAEDFAKVRTTPRDREMGG